MTLRYYLFISIFLVSICGHSETAKPGNTFELTENIKKKLDEISSISPEKYLGDIDIYRDYMSKYIDHKRKVCNGEFSMIILENDYKGIVDDDGDTLKKLSKQERKMCFRELKALHVTFISNMFISRERYLKHLHETKLKELDLSREDTIKKIQNLYQSKL